jgi:hypothetical protein
LAFHITLTSRGLWSISKKNILIPNVAEKNILILVEGKKKSDSEFLSYYLMLNSGKKIPASRAKKNKLYKDRVSTKMSKIFFLSMCDLKVSLTFTSLSLVLLLTTDLPVLFKYCYKYCYSDSRRL